MQYQIIHGYFQFSKHIHQDWIKSGVKYIKLVEVEINAPFQVFELIPDSEIPDSGDTIYSIKSKDILELLMPMAIVKFVVHETYLEEED
jgi:hypothetical protein